MSSNQQCQPLGTSEITIKTSFRLTEMFSIFSFWEEIRVEKKITNKRLSKNETKFWFSFLFLFHKCENEML